MDARQIAAHLRFYQELGVTGISKDAAWRARPEGRAYERTQPGGSRPDLQVGHPQDGSRPDLQVGHPQDGSRPDLQVEHPQDGSRPDLQVGRQEDAPVSPPVIWTLHAIREDIGDCTRCKLHTLGRRQVVFGVGNPNAELMFVGEAPGADEDVQGIPFVGRAGQLLTKMIVAMGFSRDDVYIANVVKCRPPENRNPEPDEIESCEPFLFRQIETIKPTVIVALGAFAAKTLLRTQDPISRLRGRVFDYHGAKLIPTFHPSFLLRSPNQKKYAWDDLKIALSIMGRQPPAPSGSSAAD